MKKRYIILIIILFILLIMYYLYYENNFLHISYYNINNNKIDDEFKEYKIIQISDFHNTKSKKLNKDILKNIEKENPDIIVITGDFIDVNKTDLSISINLAKKLVNLAPTYYVTGNHEAMSAEYNNLKEEMSSLGVKILDNKLEKIEINNSFFNLLGIDDPRFKNDEISDDSKIIEEEINSIEYDKDEFTILLSHRPELFQTYVEKNIDLVLTGHAHGGQIRLPIIKGIVAPNQGFFPKYTEGIFNEKNTTMIISRGIGNSIIPYRINNRPDLVVITLK